MTFQCDLEYFFIAYFCTAIYEVNAAEASFLAEDSGESSVSKKPVLPNYNFSGSFKY